MSLKIGIVGLPNVGKSTLFNALLGTNQAAASNFPFCTIEPNSGVVPVPDTRLNEIAAIEKSERIVPTTVEFVDIAGLVKGASQGQGLGNKFLSHIREVDAIIHVVRLFEDEDIIHVTGTVDPAEDIKTINLELILADLDHATKLADNMVKAVKSNNKEAKVAYDILEKIKAHLELEQPVRTMTFTDDDNTIVRTFQLLTAKPILYVANLSDSQIESEEIVSKLKSSIEPEAKVLSISAKVETELLGMEEAEKQEFLTELGLKEPGLNKLIRAGYELLGLVTYLTAGPQEARGWTITKGMNAQQAAGVIHTDFAKGFIRAEVVSFDDFIANNGWPGARQVGKVRSEGKTYIVQDGDICLFRFNV